MVEIFKTDIHELKDAKIVILQLLDCFPEAKINFDLEDCDKILRIENATVEPEKIISLLRRNGHHSEMLL